MIGEEVQGHPLPPGFEDVEPLATTGCGPVFRARVATVDGHVETVAVTVVDTPVRGRDAKRLRAECLAAVAIRSEPGVLAVRDLGFTKDHRPFLVTDAPLAGTLAARIERYGPLPVGEVVAMGLRLTRALRAAHRAGILHLGIGPDVVFPTPSGPVLGHFGLAWAVRRPSQPDVPALSIMHAPRELFGWEEPTVGSDVYSLASVLRTALDGRAPFENEARTGRPALYHRLVQGAPDPLRHPGVSPEFAALLEQMMGPDPARRPAVDEVVATLEEIARAGQISTEWVAGESRGTAPSLPATPVPTVPVPVAQQPVVSVTPPPTPAPVTPPAPVSAATQQPTVAVPAAPVGPTPMSTPIAAPGPVPAAQQPTVAVPAAPVDSVSAVQQQVRPLAPPPPPAPTLPDTPAPAPRGLVPNAPFTPLAPAQQVPTPPIAAPPQVQPPQNPVPPQPSTVTAPAVPANPVAAPATPPTPAPAPQLQTPHIPAPRPETPPTPSPTPSPDHQESNPRRRNTGLILLVAAGSAALAAGVAWGVATAPRGNPSPQASGPVVAVATFAGPQRTAYQATNAKAGATGTAITVTWNAPHQNTGVQSYIVVVTLHNQSVQTTTVAAKTLNAAFTGLMPATTYCVSVVTYAVAPGDQTPHIATPDQCAVVTTDPASAPQPTSGSAA